MSKNNDLWGSFKGLDSAPSPLSLLHKQGELLTEKTQGRIIGEVKSRITASRQQKIELFLRAPLLNNLTHSLVTAEHGLDLYPLELRFEGNTHFCDDEASFQATFEEIISSEQARKMISALLIQSRYSTPAPLHSIDEDAPAQSAQPQPSPTPTPETTPVTETSEPAAPKSKEKKAFKNAKSGDAPFAHLPKKLQKQVNHLKPGLALKKNDTSTDKTDDEQAAYDKTKVGRGFIFCTHIDENFISIMYRGANDQTYEVYFNNDEDGIQSLLRVFSFNRGSVINKSSIKTSSYKTNFPLDLI